MRDQALFLARIEDLFFGISFRCARAGCRQSLPDFFLQQHTMKM